MTRLGMTTIRRARSLDYRLYEAEIRSEMDDLRQDLKREMDDAVSDWEHKPSFDVRVVVAADSIAVQARPTGPNAQIYRWVDQGTRPHIIRARGRGALVFRTGYRPRTRPGRPHAGPGTATGPWVGAKVVHHPGTEARELSLTIAGMMRDDLRAAISRAIRQAKG